MINVNRFNHFVSERLKIITKQNNTFSNQLLGFDLFIVSLSQFRWKLDFIVLYIVEFIYSHNVWFVSCKHVVSITLIYIYVVEQFSVISLQFNSDRIYK